MQYELTGIDLVRTSKNNNFAIVLALAFFKGIFWNSEFDKNYMIANALFHYDVISEIATEML